MKIGLILGIVMVVMGVVLLVADFLAFVKKKLIEGSGLIWGMLSVLFLVSGILFLGEKEAVYWVLILLMVVLIFSLFALSKEVSVLTMKNQELAMQVSLLNHENESILQAVEQIREMREDE